MSSPTTNPFTGQSASAANIPVPGFLRDWGFRLQETMLDAARILTDGDGSLTTFFTAVFIAILFGMVHILGPGHGKLFTIGYFGSRRARLVEGLWLSALVNILDSLSAFLLVGIAYGLLSMSLRAAGAEVGRITRLIAYGAVSLLALLHLVLHFRHHHENEPDENGRTKGGMKGWMLALSVGLIPCPVSSAILAWGIVNQALGFSLILVAGVSLGGMIAMTGFSLAIIGSKKGFTSLMKNRGFLRGLNLVETASMVFLVLVGALLFVSAL